MPNEEDTTPRTAREAAQMQAAYVRGAVDCLRYTVVPPSREPSVCLSDGRVGLASAVAAELFPAPQRPRVVVDPTNSDRCFSVRTAGVGPYISESLDGGPWRACVIAATPERVALWADLFATPTEPVPDDAAGGEGAG